jgi:hypothetical protein
MSDILSQLRACVSDPWRRVCDADLEDGIEEIERLRADLAAAQAQLVSKADELVAMQKQRDEARRDACAFQGILKFNLQHPKGIISTEATLRLANEIAVDRGWDCFKQGGGA